MTLPARLRHPAPEAILVAAILVLLVFNTAATANFLTPQTAIVNLTQVATIGIVALGMSLVIATGGIDLSVGAMMAIAGALAAKIFLGDLFAIQNDGVRLAVAFVFPLIVVGVLGMFNALLIVRLRIQPFVATLILFIAGRGFAQVLTEGRLQVFRDQPFQWIGLGRIAGVPVQVILMLALCVALILVVRYTVFGRWVLAVGGNPRAAHLAGVPTGRVLALVYALSAVLAGLAGFVVISINSSSDANLVGMNMELDAIAAALVGGTLLAGGSARLAGAVLGAMFLQLLRYTLLSQGVPDAAAMVVKATIILIAVLMQKRGPEIAASVMVVWDAAGLRRAGFAVLAALLLLILFGALRYDNFLSGYNVTTVLAYNAMFACVSLGLTFVIVTGGIDLSVGAVAAFASVIAAMASTFGLGAGIAAGVVAGLGFGVVNGLLVARFGLSPFIVTLASMLAARGLALLTSGNRSVPIATDTQFMWLGMGTVGTLPVVVVGVGVLFVAGWFVLCHTPFGRTALAIGASPEAARLLGLPTRRTLVAVYGLSGALAGLAGVILAARGFAGQPTEGVGWELIAIAAVVVGGTLLTGGVGSVWGTLAGVCLLGFLFNVLNFENGKGWISLSVYWQSVLRGLVLFAVVYLQSRLVARVRGRPKYGPGNPGHYAKTSGG